MSRGRDAWILVNPTTASDTYWCIQFSEACDITSHGNVWRKDVITSAWSLVKPTTTCDVVFWCIQFSEAYDVTNYGSSWRGGFCNQCMEFGESYHYL